MGATDVTPFGKELRKLRIDYGEVSYNMAEKLHITPAYLSSIEVGRRNIPANFVEQLAELYSFSEEQLEVFNRKKIETENSVLIKLPLEPKNNVTAYEVAYQFNKNLHNLSEQQLKQLLSIITSKGE